MIVIDRQRPIGALLRELRREAGIRPLQIAQRLHISRSGVFKREAAHGIPTAALIDTARVFGYDVALVPSRHPGARPTGTGWPA